MTLLLDTHVVLWWISGARVRRAVRSAIEDADEVFVSVASAWEVAIKVALGKLALPGRFEDGVEAHGFSKLPIEFRHAEALVALPRHHADPFDRMLVAQALVEGMTLVTRDGALRAYGVPILVA